MKTQLFLSLLLLPAFGLCQEGKIYESVKKTRIGYETCYGLVSPLDQDGKNFYLQNEDGHVEVRLTENAQIGLLFRERDNHKLIDERHVTIAEAEKSYDLPERLYVKVHFDRWHSAEAALKEGKFRDGVVSAKSLPDHLPTENELWLSGEITATEEGHITATKVVTVNGKEFRGSTGGYNYSERIAGLFDHSAIKPFENQASVLGKMEKDIFMADYVFLRPIPDQAANDDPRLPRYLFIGDSISGNYGPSLRSALEGRLNLHHPPTNCGPSAKGRELMGAWLGNYKTKGSHWDVISFNFGHWDSGQTKSQYQENLESIVAQLKDTGAKLMWVTTCPVPKGYDPAGGPGKDGQAPGRTSGVMKKHLNPWALEVIKRHPEITICDQYQYVEDHAGDLYKDWWPTKDVHFKGTHADALGRLLAEHIAKLMDLKLNDLNKPTASVL